MGGALAGEGSGVWAYCMVYGLDVAKGEVSEVRCEWRRIEAKFEEAKR